jgi:hypothetical protein
MEICGATAAMLILQIHSAMIKIPPYLLLELVLKLPIQTTDSVIEVIRLLKLTLVVVIRVTVKLIRGFHFLFNQWLII